MSNDAVAAWRNFEHEMNDAGYGWTIHYAAADLAPADPAFDPMRIEHLLPEDFLAFTKEVGYPMVGYSYYCRVGFSVLPPAWQATTSMFVDGEESDPNDPCGVMFAGQELADVDGWGFRKGEAGIEVHDVEGASLTERVAGSFTEWLTKRLDLLLAYGRDPANAAEINEGKEQAEPDPHRLVDYSATAG